MRSIVMNELAKAVQEYPSWHNLKIDSARVHIAVMRQPFLDYVFEGKKTVESRFSLHKIAPYQKVESDDLVLLKAGPIVGCFTADWVKYLELTPAVLEQIKNQYGNAICGDDAFWQSKQAKRYATLIGIRDVIHLPPITISKADRRGWIMI